MKFNFHCELRIIEGSTQFLKISKINLRVNKLYMTYRTKMAANHVLLMPFLLIVMGLG